MLGIVVSEPGPRTIRLADDDLWLFFIGGSGRTVVMCGAFGLRNCRWIRAEGRADFIGYKLEAFALFAGLVSAWVGDSDWSDGAGSGYSG